MKNKKGLKRLGLALAFIAGGIGLTAGLSAQEMGKDKGMKDIERPPEIVNMMQEPNKVLSNGSIQYLATFTNLLHIQASQRPDQINESFIKGAFGEIRRAFEMTEKFQQEHVKTMDAAMQEKVKMMMERMNKNLAGIKTQIILLEKEINSGNKLDGIIASTGMILEYLNDLAMMRSGMPGSQGMSGGKK